MLKGEKEKDKAFAMLSSRPCYDVWEIYVLFNNGNVYELVGSVFRV